MRVSNLAQLNLSLDGYEYLMDDSDYPAPRASLAGAIAGHGLTERTANPMVDRIRGAFLGAALGDAVGLQVEGSDRFTVADRHPNGVDFPYKGAYKGHAPGDWTDATDMAVLVARTLGAYMRSEVDDPIADLATRLAGWLKGGFPELGDFAGLNPESVVFRAVNSKDYVKRPLAAASEVMGAKGENGAMLRSIACAFTTHPAEWADALGHVTHSDPRSLATAVSFTHLIRSLAEVPAGAAVSPECMRAATRAGCIALTDPAQRLDFVARLTESKEISKMRIDDREERSYAVMTMACAVWALRGILRTPADQRSPDLYKRMIREIAAEGGDAGANCFVVGAMLGALMGTSGLPADWMSALPGIDWLEDEVGNFITAAVPAISGLSPTA